MLLFEMACVAIGMVVVRVLGSGSADSFCDCNFEGQGYIAAVFEILLCQHARCGPERFSDTFLRAEACPACSRAAELAWLVCGLCLGVACTLLWRRCETSACGVVSSSLAAAFFTPAAFADSSVVAQPSPSPN